MKPLKERKSSDPRGLAYKIAAASHAANPSYGPHDPTLDPKTNFGAAATRASAVAGLKAARKIKKSQGDIRDPEHIETISKNIHGAPEDFGGVSRGWSSAALTDPNQTDSQRERRAKLTVPYDKLSDEEKEKDRQIANVVTDYINEACWEGYKQVGMKNKGGKMVPNCVPMEESILKFAQTLATAKSAANKPLAGKKSEPKLPSASGVVKGGAPEPRVHTAKNPENTADGINSNEFGAAIKKLMQKKLEESPSDMYTMEQFVGMLEEAGYPMDEGAKEYLRNLFQRGVLQKTPEPQKPDFKNMTPKERQDYMAGKLDYMSAPLSLIARAGTEKQKQQARYALRKPMAEEINEYCPRCLMEVLTEQHPEQLGEAQYQGRTVQLGKPMRGDVKKFKVFVKDPSTGNVKKVNFGDKTMRIKKSIPARRKSFRARHKCSTAKDRTSARYWSCRAW